MSTQRHDDHDNKQCSAAQVLVYFAVAKMGDKPQDGKTELNPEGLTAATGKHAQAVADLFAKGDLSCKVGSLGSDLSCWVLRTGLTAKQCPGAGQAGLHKVHAGEADLDFVSPSARNHLH